MTSVIGSSWIEPEYHGKALREVLLLFAAFYF